MIRPRPKRFAPVPLPLPESGWSCNRTVFMAAPCRGLFLEGSFRLKAPPARWIRLASGGGARPRLDGASRRTLVAGSALAGRHVGEDGEDAPVIVVALSQVELHEDRGHVLLHCALGDHASLADALVGASLGDELDHLPLARCEQVERVVRAAAPCEKLRDDLRVEHGAAFIDP